MTAAPHLVADIGGTYLRLGLLGASGRASILHRAPTPEALSPDPVTGLAAALRAAEDALDGPAASLTLGLPGSFDAAMQTVLSAPNLPCLEGRAIVPELAAACGRAVRAERDVVLLARGEWAAGAGARAASLLGVFVGTGIGGAYLSDGAPFRGASGGAAELGHLPVLGEGRRCVCGNLDCVEAYACGGVLARLAAVHGVALDGIWSGTGSGALAPELDLFIEALARGLASAVNMLDPEVLVLGGGVPEMAGFPRDRLLAAFRAHLRRPVPADHVAVRFAALGEAAAFHGAPAHPTGDEP